MYRQVLQKGSSALTLSSLPLFELDHHHHHQSSNYQSSISRDLSSCASQGGDHGGVGVGDSGGGVSRSNFPRGLRLILAPAEDDLNLDSAPPSYPPSTASLTPSPLLPPDSPYPALVTPNSASKRAEFPDLPPPPPQTSVGFTLQLPPAGHPSHHRCSADPILDTMPDGGVREEGSLAPSVVLGSSLDGEQEGDSKVCPAGVQLRGKPGLTEEGVWRRHMSLEVNPLLLLSSSPDGNPSDLGGSLGKSLSAQNLSQPLIDRAPPLSSPLNSSSSSSSSGSDGSHGNAHGNLSNWGDTELFIGECKQEPAEEHFSFLSEGADLLSSPTVTTRGHSNLLQAEVGGSTSNQAGPHTPMGSAESLSQPTDIQLT